MPYSLLKHACMSILVPYMLSLLAQYLTLANSACDVEYFNAKQKHIGCKKLRGQSEAGIK